MKNYNSMVGLSPELRAVLAGLGDSGLPPIRGKWFVVDPYKTTSPEGGVEGAYADLQTAYAQCVTNAGDGILVLGSNADSTAANTSYQKSPLVWSKNGITVVGACAPTRTYQRARIANKIVTKTATTISYTGDHTISDSAGGFLTAGFEAGQYLAITNASTNTNDFAVVAEGGSADFIRIDSVTASTITTTSTSAHVTTESAATAGQVVLTSYNWQVMKVTGSNNSFYNLHIVQGDNTAYALDALYVSGARNYFQNVHAATGLASAATVLTRSLALIAAEENTFVNCTFGNDTVDRGNNATYDVYLYGAVKRNFFFGCQTIRYASAGTACGAVMLDTTEYGQPTTFDDCRFTCNNVTQMAKAILMNGANGKHWLTGGTSFPGYAAQGGALVVYNTGPTSSTAGVSGVGTTPAS